ncbi:MAG: Hpt domain-containing protein [Desulfobacterales bacterium]
MQNQIHAAKEKIRPLVEGAAERLVMADLSDSSERKSLSDSLFSVSRELEQDFPRSAKAAETAAEILSGGNGKSRQFSDSDLPAIEQVVSGLQTLVEKDAEDHEPDFPEEFSPQVPGGQDKPPAAKTAESLAPGADLEIMGEYIAQQEAVLSEIEECVLEFEQNKDAEVLKALKRLLHTAKGEAGVIGLTLISDVCHQVEDYIQKQEGSLQADLLLEFKDWFEQTVLALKNETEPPSPEGLSEALNDSAAGAEADRDSETAGAEDEKQRQDDPGSTKADITDAESGEKDKEDYPEGLLDPVAIEDPEITADFVSEVKEHFDIADENLLVLENEPENEEAVASIFRAFHTIKGTGSFLGLTPISVLAHKAENLLDEVRRKNLDFDGEVVDATFNALDLLKKMNKDLEQALASDGMYAPPRELPGVFEQLKSALAGETHVPAGNQEQSAGKKQTGRKEGGSKEPETEESSGTQDLPAAARESAGAVSRAAPAANSGRTVRQTMKIDPDRIDLLLETIGELVIVESIVSQEASGVQEGSRDLERNLGQLKKITRSLQDIGMSMRLIPIDNTFRKMGRLVRDLSKKSGKKIELVMEGKETELDKGMVEMLGDPLVHMIRNAVDHGIEHTAEERIAAGKDATGTIILRAYHQGGNIHIDISDDGRGLDREAIAAKAIERGISQNIENMTDEEVFALIFEPGFSTAKQITDVSGRGVGMDVVKSNIEGMRGNVRIASKKGKGSTFTLVLPLTMAIIDGMIVKVGSERYILPLLSIIESFQPTREMITTVSGKGETVPFRNRLLPLFRLYALFGTSDAKTDPTRALVVVIEDAGRQVALLVDELLGQNQTVIKNLGQGLRDVEGIAGASIMPDGTPGLIIDVNGIVKLATA